MTVAIVKKREWTNKGVDIFERNVVPQLLEHDQVEAIEYDRADMYQTPEHHWFLGYLGRYKRGRLIAKAIQNNGYDTVFLPFQELLTFDPSAVDSQIIPYVHDVFPATTTFAGPIPTFLARRYVRNLVECELVLCASEQTKADIRYRTPFDNRVEVVYQGVDSPGPPSDAEPKYDLMYVGSLLQRKNPSLLRQCIGWAIDQGFDCIAVLSEYDDENALPCEVRRDVPRKTLGELYSRSRFYLHPSKQEGFGRPPVEAQSVGTPPIALDIPINAEVLGPKGEAWIPMSTVEDVLVALEMDIQQYETHSRAGVENSRRYSWTKTVEQLGDYLL